MAGFRIREGKVTATVGAELEQLIRNTVEQSLPGVLGAMTKAVDEVNAGAYGEWPVRTGRSRSGLTVSTLYDLTRREVRVGIRNDVDYAIYVRTMDGQTTAWTRFVRAPMNHVTKKIATDLGDVILRAYRKAAA